MCACAHSRVQACTHLHLLFTSLALAPYPSLLIRRIGKKQIRRIGKKQTHVVSALYFARSDFAVMLTLRLIYPCPKWHADFLIRGFYFVICALGNVPLRWQNLIIVFIFTS